MIQFLLLTFLLVSALWVRPLLVNRFIEPENNHQISKIYYVNILSIYLTLLFSDEFYITTYLGWAASIILVYGYIKKYFI
jgi:hypothetical protein